MSPPRRLIPGGTETNTIVSNITGWGLFPYSTRPVEGDRGALASMSARKLKTSMEKPTRSCMKTCRQTCNSRRGRRLKQRDVWLMWASAASDEGVEADVL